MEQHSPEGTYAQTCSAVANSSVWRRATNRAPAPTAGRSRLLRLCLGQGRSGRSEEGTAGSCKKQGEHALWGSWSLTSASLGPPYRRPLCRQNLGLQFRSAQKSGALGAGVESNLQSDLQNQCNSFKTVNIGLRCGSGIECMLSTRLDS